MFRNKLLLLILNLVYVYSFSQNEVLEVPVGYQSTFFDGKEALAISNENTGDLVLFIEDVDISKVYLLNKNLEITSEFIIKSLPSSFKNFIGHQINDNGSYSIFFTNTNKRKYGELNLDFSNKVSTNNEIDFKFKKEAYMESVSFKGKFYMMSATKSSNDVNFYNFKNGTFSKNKTISFDFLETVSSDGYKKQAYHHLVTKGLGASGSLVKMDINIPNSIDITSKPNKLYTIDNQFVFTFDNDKNKTKVVTLSPETFEFTVSEFDQPITNQIDFINHNSYLYDDKIFQIKSSASLMKFTIKDLNTKELLKEITLNKKDSITFKNTPIIQEGPGLFAGKKTREMEETTKFLRKISRGDIGISVFKQNDDYKIILGSKIEIRSGGGGFSPMGGFGGIPMGGIGPFTMSFNPTFYAYGGYSSSKSTHIDCLFDSEFKHVQGEISKNVFDKIKSFEDEYENKQKLKNVFFHSSKLYFGYLSTIDKNYHLVEFL